MARRRCALEAVEKVVTARRQPPGPRQRRVLAKVSSVSLKRLTPTIKDLGYLRLWQDELEEIVALVRQQLSNETIVLESDGNELDDVAVDLPKLGHRVRYFTIKVTGRPDEGSEVPREILTVSLTRSRCRIEATNPDVTTRGVISDIQDVAQRCRRVPLWYPQMNIFSLSPPAALQGTASSQVGARELCWILLFALSAAGTIIGALAVPGTLTFGSSNHRLPLIASLAILVPCATILMTLLVGDALARTILFTGTRQGAPTFWQRNRNDIIINVLVAGAFYLLGLLTANG